MTLAQIRLFALLATGNVGCRSVSMLHGTCRWNGYTSFLTTGAGSWGEPNDSCGKPGSYLYTNGGEPAASQAMHSCSKITLDQSAEGRASKKSLRAAVGSQQLCRIWQGFAEAIPASMNKLD